MKAYINTIEDPLKICIVGIYNTEIPVNLTHFQSQTGH